MQNQSALIDIKYYLSQALNLIKKALILVFS